MNKLLLVARETYFRQVKSWAFLFMLLSPFIFLFITIGTGFLVGNSKNSSDSIAVVTNLDEVYQSFKGALNNTERYVSRKAAMEALKKDKVSAFLMVDDKKGVLTAKYHSKKNMTKGQRTEIMYILSQLQNQINFQKSNMSVDQIRQLLTTPNLTEDIQQVDENNNLGKKLAFYIIIFAMYFIILTYSSSTAQEFANEKGTKIMEVILSSVSASTYFYGRILGILAIIATHIGTYILGGYVSYLLLENLSISEKFIKNIDPTLKLVLSNLNWSMVLFVVFGILLYVVLSALCGSLVVRAEDANKAVQPAIYLIMICLFGAVTLGEQSQENILLKVGSYVPFISSFFMPIRLINGCVNSLEVIISLLILFSFIVFLIYCIGQSYAGIVLQTDDLGFLKSLKKGLNNK